MSGDAILNNRYRLLRQHGSGGMAVIYESRDEELGRKVAVKMLRPSLIKNDVTFLERFRQEARSVANLQHPNIVTVHDTGNDGPNHYIVMEFVDGRDLKKIIKMHGALSVERALDLSIQICAGIGFAHRAGLVHADIKPQNILVTKDDNVKITDFGIAQALTETQAYDPNERQEVVWGSPHYFAPEQARGERPTPASDVYAIGIVMFEMLTGRLPFSGPTQHDLAMAHIRERVPMVTEINPGVPESLARIVFKVMSKNPSDRYGMADQLGRVLETYRDKGRNVTAPHPAHRSTPPPPPRTIPSSAQVQPPSPYPSPPPAAPQTQPRGYADPTQRYSVAPDAPQSPNYGGQQGKQIHPLTEQHSIIPPPPRSMATGEPQYQTGPYPSTPPQTGPYRTGPYSPDEELPSSLDVVTIALAALAFLAVACLIPLYIAVFQARAG